jgi:hypothetical protein
MKIQGKTICSADHEEIFVKDMAFARFLSKFPRFSDLACEMRKVLPDGYQHYLVDFIVKECVPGDRTCKDVRWHVDGEFDKDNKYVLWARGPNRTLFPAQTTQIDMFPSDREQQNRFLEKLMEDRDFFEVPEQTMVSYDSRTPHRGVICKTEGKRLFVRMMATNYIKPKNIIRESANASFQ